VDGGKGSKSLYDRLGASWSDRREGMSERAWFHHAPAATISTTSKWSSSAQPGAHTELPGGLGTHQKLARTCSRCWVPMMEARSVSVYCWPPLSTPKTPPHPITYVKLERAPPQTSNVSTLLDVLLLSGLARLWGLPRCSDRLSPPATVWLSRGTGGASTRQGPSSEVISRCVQSARRHATYGCRPQPCPGSC
jgi:hypothetical protein